MSPVNGRAEEIRSVAPEHHTVWLAGQIDEVEAVVLDAQRALSTQLTALTRERQETREQMHSSTQRITWTVLTASITLLLSVVGFVLSQVIGT